MKTGSKVVCNYSRGYDLTEGKEYTLLDYEPQFYENDNHAGFTWPATVILKDDGGDTIQCHAMRFTLKDS